MPVISTRMERAMPRGFDLRDIRKGLGTFNRRNLFISSGWAVIYHSSIVVTALAAIAAFEYVGFLSGIAAYFASILWIARQQRGLELMLHDASHGTWHRDRTLNNVLADFLVAIPMLQTTRSYWESHAVHHTQFGSDNDPCRRRFREVREDLSKQRWLRGIGRYILGYYAEVSCKPVAILRMVAWHMVIFGLPTAEAFGTGTALKVWLLFWFVPQFVVLPPLRMIAELEEHDYDNCGKTEADCTFTNIARLHRWLIHPWQDSYHWIHHALPAVPEYRHKKLHRFLLKHSASYKKSMFRKHILGAPENLPKGSSRAAT